MTSIIAKIKKRNGETVMFDPNKVQTAIEKAFFAVRGGVDAKLSDSLSKQVIDELEKRFPAGVPSVEDVQNVVEAIMMAEGYFDVAKSYIIYRYEHTKQRQEKKQEVEKKLDEGGLYVIKRSGERVPYSEEKLRRSISYYIEGYESIINLDAVVLQVRQEIFEDISTKDIDRSIVMVLRTFIEHDPAYSFAAARALHTQNYKIVIGHDKINFSKLEVQLREVFTQKIKEGVSLGKLDPRVLVFDLERLSKALDFSRDKLHPYLSMQTLYDRYFLRDNFETEVLEVMQTFWMRVAMGMALTEGKDRDEWAIKFYEEMSTLRYVPSTPTLFHAASVHPQLSSCYLTTVEDSLDHIFKCIGDNAQLSKWSGGIGNDWTNLRGTGALIKGTGVSSQGVIPFLKIANDTTGAINRSGRRRGATCVYLETWHWDIEDFLELRKNTGDERRRTHDMDTANWIPDLFMKRVKEDGMWSLFSPEETPDLHHTFGKDFEERYTEYEEKGKNGQIRLFRQMKARDLWKKMLSMLFETGHPWITWKDACNVRSPQDHDGTIHSSNLCTEITLNTSADETAVCNLGSINLERFIKDGKFNEEQVAKTVTTAMRMLDNTIDINFYPTIEAKNSNFRHRPVGLGVRGLQDALYMLDIRFDSEDMVTFSDKSTEMVAYYAYLASSQLAKERGTYKSYRGSKWSRGILPQDTVTLLEQERGMSIDVPRHATMDWTPVREHIKKYGMRNSNCLAIAPSATTANISGCFPTIEPIYKNIYVKSNQAGDFVIVNTYLIDELKRLNLWDAEMLGKLKYHDGKLANITEIPQHLKDKYKEAFEIDSKWLIKAAAYRGRWIDQSQSLNIFYGGKSGKEINDIFMYAWEMGIKTTYYMRTLAASQVEKSTVNAATYGDTHKRTSTVTADLQPVMSAPAMPTPAAASVSSGPKACSIDNPECESCQG